MPLLVEGCEWRTGSSKRVDVRELDSSGLCHQPDGAPRANHFIWLKIGCLNCMTRIRTRADWKLMKSKRSSE